MNNQIELYRGDYSKIKQFEFGKTSKYSLLGQGIYLTDSLKVAKSYRTKGAEDRSHAVLFMGEATDRNDAFEKSLFKFAELKYSEDEGIVYWRHLQGKITPKVIEKYRKAWMEARERGEIVAEYTTEPIHIYSKFTAPTSIRARQKEAIKVAKRHIKVTYTWETDVGYITKFIFDKNVFEANIINVNRGINDRSFWELMWDYSIAVGTPYDDRASYIDGNVGCKISEDGSSSNYTSRPGFATKDKYIRMAKVLKSYGILGYEYDGGILVGGKGLHRAFCIWDDEYVNQHKIGRI